MSDEDLVNDFLKQAEALYGPRFPRVTFEVLKTPAMGAQDSNFDPAAKNQRSQ